MSTAEQQLFHITRRLLRFGARNEKLLYQLLQGNINIEKLACIVVAVQCGAKLNQNLEGYTFLGTSEGFAALQFLLDSEAIATSVLLTFFDMILNKDGDFYLTALMAILFHLKTKNQLSQQLKNEILLHVASYGRQSNGYLDKKYTQI